MEKAKIETEIRNAGVKNCIVSKKPLEAPYMIIGVNIKELHKPKTEIAAFLAKELMGEWRRAKNGH